jgi:hypothetical protein
MIKTEETTYKSIASKISAQIKNIKNTYEEVTPAEGDSNRNDSLE